MPVTMPGLRGVISFSVAHYIEAKIDPYVLIVAGAILGIFAGL
jgi:hypothetical protein